MKALTSILIVLALFFTVWKVWEYWDKVSTEREVAEEKAKKPLDPSSLPGLDYKLEQPLREAQAKGADGLKDWLEKYRKVTKDPRLAAIELDYVVLVAPQNPGEAKKLFAAVKQRTPPESPIYRKVQELEKTYE
jgi:hypothetical protein